MANLTDSVACPFCGCDLVLGDCPIVATNRANALTAAAFDPPSGAPVLDRIGGWPVVAPAPTSTANGRKRGVFRSDRPLPPVDEVADPRDLPARLCPDCQTPLPVDIDDRDLFTVAIVGTQGSAKTHYIASAVHEAYHLGALDPFGCTEFAPDENTGPRYHDTYFAEVYKRHTALEATRINREIRFDPLAFRVTFARDRRPFMLLIHDVAGEVLMSRGERAVVAPFVRRAHAIVFLVDALGFDHVRRAVLPTSEAAVDPGYNQADLLHAVVNELRGRRVKDIPVAVTISKSDLLIRALDGPFRFAEPVPTDRDAWQEQLKAIDGEVRSTLAELGARDLLSAASRLPSASYHAVAPIGTTPRQDGTIDEVRPMRCLDPLISVLSRIPGVRL